MKVAILATSRSTTKTNAPPRWVRRIAAGLLPLLILCMVGVPLPNLRPKDLTERFPCERCACGCKSAAHCWDKCCCFTDEEKLDWAEKNRVQAPKFLADRVAYSRKVKVKSATVSLTANSAGNISSATSPKRGSCCQAKVQSPKRETAQEKAACIVCSVATGADRLNCCAGKSASCREEKIAGGLASMPKKICCGCGKEQCSSELSRSTGSRGTEGQSTPKHSTAQSLDTDERPNVVMLESALKCQGIQMALLLFKSALQPSNSLLVFNDPSPLGDLEIFDQAASTIYLDLDGPVPRHA